MKALRLDDRVLLALGRPGDELPSRVESLSVMVPDMLAGQPGMVYQSGDLRLVLGEKGEPALHPDEQEWELRDWPEEVVRRVAGAE